MAYTDHIPTIYIVYGCYIHGTWLLYAILLRILTTSREIYIDITRIANPPRNSRSPGHRCTLNEHWKFRDLYHSYTIASWSAKDTFNIPWCLWYIPCIYNVYIHISLGHIQYTMMFMVYTMYTWKSQYISVYTSIYIVYCSIYYWPRMPRAMPRGAR